MSIQVELPEEFYTDDEEQRLMELFGSRDNQEFSDAIRKVTLAALTEYKEMFLGQGLPSRADEIRQHRLYFLTKYFFEGRLPSEAEVSSMFQLTRSRSRSLLRYVITRFHYDLENETRKTLINALSQAQFDEDKEEYRLNLQSDIVLEELNRIIGMVAPNLDPITKVRNMARTYSISVDSFSILGKHLNID